MNTPLIKSVLTKKIMINIAMVGGGIDSAVGYLHYCSLNMEQKFKLITG